MQLRNLSLPGIFEHYIGHVYSELEFLVIVLTEGTMKGKNVTFIQVPNGLKGYLKKKKKCISLKS